MGNFGELFWTLVTLADAPELAAHIPDDARMMAHF